MLPWRGGLLEFFGGMQAPPLLQSKAEARAWCVEQKHSFGKTVVLVPTLGGLHEGHLRLVRDARNASERTSVLVSIYLNETQFSRTESEDFESYPRSLHEDLQQLAGLADAVLAPANGSLYSCHHQTSVVPELLQYQLCGSSRPHFFKGVATVVTKLLNICSPDFAIFGKKDYQQLLIIRRLVLELDLPTSILSSPLTRASDGLALSSRNARLSHTARSNALSIHHALTRMRTRVTSLGAHNVSASEIESQAASEIEAAGLQLDHVTVVNGLTLSQCSKCANSIAQCAPSQSLIDELGRGHGEDDVVLAVAAKIDGVRLTDNIALLP
jgi:pantoate--beta-alanine ligase